MSALETLSPPARAFHDDYWHWLWFGPNGDMLIGDKKAELRQRYGVEAEQELLAALRADGYLSTP